VAVAVGVAVRVVGEVVVSAGFAVVFVWFFCAVTTAPDLLSRGQNRTWMRVSLGFGRRDQMVVGERYRIALAIATDGERRLHSPPE
jgi:hypothetical protein